MWGLPMPIVRLLHWLACRVPRRPPAIRPLPLPPGATDGRVRVAPSTIPGAGLGGFAARDFRRGEVVAEYTGDLLSTRDVLRTEDVSYVMGLGLDRTGRAIWVDPRWRPEVMARYINHHVDEARRNLEVEARPDERRALLVATRDIAEGEELFYDYGERYWAILGRRPS